MNHFYILPLIGFQSYSLNQVLTLEILTFLLFGVAVVLIYQLKAKNKVLLREINDRELIQQELQHVHTEAENAVLGKSEFLAAVSDNIRGPMSGIIGMVELALATNLTEEQKDYLHTLRKSANSMLAMINEIMDFSRIEAGKVELETIHFNLRECLESSLKNLTLTAEANGLQLRYRMEDDIPDTLVGDPGRVRQIVVNILKNAVQYTQEGEITFHIETSVKTEDEVRLVFAVSDTGIGIPPEKQKSIFKAFQTKDSLSQSFKGAGLGLPITAQLVRMMGGDIEVQSPIRDAYDGAGGPGTTFLFTLPFGIQNKSELEIQQEILTLKDIPVLIVDDCLNERKFLERMVSFWEMKPVSVRNAVEAMMAMEYARNTQTPFALAILDANLSEIDGFALAREIKQSEHFKDTKTIILTSTGMRGDGRKCRELGISAYLTKPVDQSDMLNAIVAVMESSVPEGQTLITRHSLRENRRSLHILLAEDNKISQKFAVKLLERWGHHVMVVSSGKEAVSAVEEHQNFDLILMDIQMPEMDGIQATHAIREIEGRTGRMNRIIAMTTAGTPADLERYIEAGMNGFVSKPVRIDELNAVIKTAMADTQKTEFLFASAMV